MNRRKPNITRWYALGLVVMLAAGALVISIGVTWARYRTDVNGSVFFQARKPLAVWLGAMETADDGSTVFNPTAQHSWEQVEGELVLDFTVANGTSSEVFEEENQKFNIRLIGSLGAWSDEKTAAIYLEIPPAEELPVGEGENREGTVQTPATAPAEPTRVKATAVRIEPNTQLWNTFGDGWTFCFLDEQTGEELVWTLEGGDLSCLDLGLVIVGDTLTDTSLLQLRVFRVP